MTKEPPQCVAKDLGLVMDARIKAQAEHESIILACHGRQDMAAHTDWKTPA